jgi:hypothetical protein
LKLRPLIIGLLLTTLAFAATLAAPKATAVDPAVDPFETRCGWFSNPTPANIWLDDRDGEWIIGVQGGYQVESDWEWPAFKKGQWVETNGHHGYGCACLAVRVDKETHHVLEIKNARARTLAACRRDRSLKRL